MDRLGKWDDFRSRRQKAWEEWTAEKYKQKRTCKFRARLWLSIVLNKNKSNFESKREQFINKTRANYAVFKSKQYFQRYLSKKYGRMRFELE